MDVLNYLGNNLLTNRHLIVVLLSFYVFAYLMVRRASARSENTEKMWNIVFWAGVGAIIGARLFHILPTLSLYLSHPFDFIQVNFGLNMYGGFLGGLLGAALGARRAGVSFGTVATLSAPFVLVGIAVDRFGCLVESDACFGKVASLPLGIGFPGLAQTRIPSQLYEGLLVLALIGGVLYIERRWPEKAHAPVFAALGGYALIRSVIDLTRLGWPSTWMGMDVGFGIVLAIACAAAIPTWSSVQPRLAGMLPKRAEPTGPPRRRGQPQRGQRGRQRGRRSR